MQAHQRHKEGENVDSEGSDNPNPLEHTPDLSCTDCHPITRNLSEDLDNYLDTFQEQVQSVSYYTQVSFDEFQQTIDPVIINNSIARLYRSIRFIESPSFIKFRRHFLDYFSPTPDSETSSINLDLATTEEGYHHDLSVLLEREEQSTEDSPRFTSVEDLYPLPDFEEEEDLDLLFDIFDPPSPILPNQPLFQQLINQTLADQSAAAARVSLISTSTGISLPQFDLT